LLVTAIGQTNFIISCLTGLVYILFLGLKFLLQSNLKMERRIASFNKNIILKIRKNKLEIRKIHINIY